MKPPSLQAMLSFLLFGLHDTQVRITGFLKYIGVRNHL